jgi:hypothetical protein
VAALEPEALVADLDLDLAAGAFVHERLELLDALTATLPQPARAVATAKTRR